MASDGATAPARGLCGFSGSFTGCTWLAAQAASQGVKNGEVESEPPITGVYGG